MKLIRIALIALATCSTSLFAADINCYQQDGEQITLQYDQNLDLCILTLKTDLEIKDIKIEKETILEGINDANMADHFTTCTTSFLSNSIALNDDWATGELYLELKGSESFSLRCEYSNTAN